MGQAVVRAGLGSNTSCTPSLPVPPALHGVAGCGAGQWRLVPGDSSAVAMEMEREWRGQMGSGSALGTRSHSSLGPSASWTPSRALVPWQ